MKKFAVALSVAMLGLVSQAHAALDLAGVTVDTTDFETIAVFLIGALVVFWGIRKGIALIGR